MYTLDGRTVLERPGISVLRHVSGACPDVSVYRFAAQRSPAQRSAPRSNVAWNVRSPLRSRSPGFPSAPFHFRSAQRSLALMYASARRCQLRRMKLSLSKTTTITLFLINFFFTGTMPPNGKLPVLNWLAAHKSAFSPHRSDSLNRFMLNLAQPRSRGAPPRSAWPCKISRQLVPGIGNAAPKWHNFHFSVESMNLLTSF